jgi:hypothetical protein
MDTEQHHRTTTAALAPVRTDRHHLGTAGYPAFEDAAGVLESSSFEDTQSGVGWGGRAPWRSRQK